MGTRHADALQVVQAAYDLRGTPADWLKRLMTAIAPEADAGLGMAIFTYAYHDGCIEVTQCMTRHRSEKLLLQTFHALAPATLTNRLYRARAGCATLSHMSPAALSSKAFRLALRWRGAEDLLGINVIDIADAGLAIGAPLKEVRPLNRADDSRWARLGAHIVAGMRLRRGLSETTAHPLCMADLVLESDYRVAHAQGPAQVPSVLHTLRDIAIRNDKFKSCEDSTRLLDAWQALVLGRWSLVDCFDTDGRKYIVACPNEPDVRDPRQLTPRERQVANYVSLGFSDKLIGYHLGLDRSTVASHVQQIRKKLSIGTRIELVELVSALRGVDPVYDPPTR